MKVAQFQPARDIPDLAGRVFLITGGTGGLGKESVLELAKHNPGHILFTGRNLSRAEQVIAHAKANGASSVTFVPCDLASLESVKSAAKQINASVSHLDVLLANAGIMAVTPALTTDGYEIQFGTNHLGHALLIRLLLDTVQRSPDGGRVVSLTSLGMMLAPGGGIQFDTLRTKRESGFGAGWINYGQSKLANVLYAQELSRRYPGLAAVSIHPGVVQTDLVATLGFWSWLLVQVTTPLSQLSPEDGAKNELWACTVEKETLTYGAFYEPVGEKGREDKNTRNVELAKELWEWTEKELEPFLL